MWPEDRTLHGIFVSSCELPGFAGLGWRLCVKTLSYTLPFVPYAAR
jgi:hypothetical protein